MHPALQHTQSQEETLQKHILVTDDHQHDTRLTEIQDIGGGLTSTTTGRRESVSAQLMPGMPGPFHIKRPAQVFK